jgi:formylglycine-generating enzyme required for sulfatase activity
MGKYEVTQGQWKAIMGSNPSSFNDCGDDCPVENVSRTDVDKFVTKLNAKGEGKYRLPTEGEWEYACRAITEGEYGGTGILDEMGWYIENSDNKPHPVGQKQKNRFGLFDMHGNVSEWTTSEYKPYKEKSEVDAQCCARNPDRPIEQILYENESVFRGGSWLDKSVKLRSAYRNTSPPTEPRSYIGFRIVREK